MATQTIGPIFAPAGLTNLVAYARAAAGGPVIGTSATLAAATGSPVTYFPVFTDLTAGEYYIELRDADDEVRTIGWCTVENADGTYTLYSLPSSDRPPTIETIERESGPLDNTLKVGERLRFSDADGSTSEEHDVTITKVP